MIVTCYLDLENTVCRVRRQPQDPQTGAVIRALPRNQLKQIRKKRILLKMLFPIGLIFRSTISDSGEM